MERKRFLISFRKYMILLSYILCHLLTVQSKQSPDCFDELQVPSDQLVVVHLFEWKWDDIASECENYLQHTGIGAVQVSPPNEHVVFEVNGDRPWWLRYQPVSYKLESRSGTEQQFIDMVKRCHKVGIKIIVDAVINHMTGANMHGQGSGGSHYNSTPFKEFYSAVPYSAEDFNDNICNRNIGNYNDPWEVRNCRLVGLLDLKLSRPEVQEKVATYLNHLIDLGVAGFRIDASKHMYPGDILQILNRLKKLNTEFFPPNKCPFIVHEVIDQGPEAIKGSEYTSLGRITNFRYGLDLSAGGPPSTGSPYFVTRSPTFDSNGHCERTSGWVCEHRWSTIRRMTLFRSEVAEQPVNNMVTEDNRIAFSRGRRGFFALNNDGKYSWVRTVQTGLRPGVYCDMITGEVAGPGCTGKSVIVNKDGTVNLFLRSGRVMAISTASMISLPRAFKHTIVFIRKETSYGQHVFLRGGIMKHIAPVCKSLDTAASAIPIVHVGEATMEDKEFKQWSKNDIYLNWHGSEPMQGRK
ncbi:hypothetical protein M514_09650 [Trichuris suis]|uniref:Alpha-amylase n=1 Tax=Trichuris suis TaxID=68888 RepID=A0A085NJT4_9BILA|nr:hypothetical protein M513_09650 [Trichuris suis]KFD69730.1 hypothetical protein M514_09650 [Trichuris suis]